MVSWPLCFWVCDETQHHNGKQNSSHQGRQETRKEKKSWGPPSPLEAPQWPISFYETPFLKGPTISHLCSGLTPKLSHMAFWGACIKILTSLTLRFSFLTCQGVESNLSNLILVLKFPQHRGFLGRVGTWKQVPWKTLESVNGDKDACTPSHREYVRACGTWQHFEACQTTRGQFY